jgi:pimeloyl-ACP methyl ester carboxylesterase
MGGNLVLNFAFKYPLLVRSVVVAGLGAGTTNRAQFERDIQASVAMMRTQGMQAFVDVYAKGPSRLPFLRKDPVGWRLFAQQFAEHSAEGSSLTQLGVQMRRPNIFDQKAQLSALHLPALILIGDEDEPCVDAAVLMKRELPAAGLVVIPQTGHTVNLEEPALFNQAVANFLHVVEHGGWASRGEVSTSLLPEDART